MLHHIVLMKFKDGAAEADVTRLVQMLDAYLVIASGGLGVPARLVDATIDGEANDARADLGKRALEAIAAM